MKRAGSLILILLTICIISFSGNFIVVNANSSASSMIVLEASTNRILYEQNAYSRRFNASTTKILTAITVLENANIEDIVNITAPAVGVEGSSIYLEVNEKVSVKDLLYGLMLQSGNDAATALAIHVSGSVKAFAALMNTTAQKAGAKSSNFVNPHGLHSDNHYTTAYDLGLISTYALKNEYFKMIVATKEHKFYRQGKGYLYSFKNKNKILHTVDGGDGIKTGYTKRAGRCLVSSSTKNGMQVVCVVLNCGPMFEESRNLLNRAHNEYQLVEILPSYSYVGMASVKNGKASEVKAYAKLPIIYPLRQGELNSIVRVTEYNDLVAPIKKNQEIGIMKNYLHNRLLFSQKLYSIDSVKSLQITDMLKELLDDWF